MRDKLIFAIERLINLGCDIQVSPKAHRVTSRRGTNPGKRRCLGERRYLAAEIFKKEVT